MSNSDDFLRSRQQAPTLSVNTWKSVSEYRRQTLESEAANGLFREPGGGIYKDTGLSNVGSVGRVKTANLSNSNTISGAGGASWRGAGGADRLTPETYSPLWLNSNLNLPRDRATVNAWARAFFALNPIVHNAISLHSTYPIAKLSIKCKDPKIEQFFSAMCEEIDLTNICCQLAQEYWTVGEAFVYAELDNNAAKWARLVIQNPDYMVVQRSVVAGEPIISLRPDENLRRICTSSKPSDLQQKQQLNRNIIDAVKRGQNIPLSNFYVSHLANRISPYEIRGTSLIVSCFRALMLWDQIKECKYAQTSDMINPMRIFKVGGGVSNYQPTPADIEHWTRVIEEASGDKNFKLVTHDGFATETVGAGSGIYDTSADITQLMKELYIGLMVPNVIMDGGGDISYQNGGVALDVLRQRYVQFRNYLTNWLRRKIFAPIAKINGFYEYKDTEKHLIIPDVEWNHMSLFDTGDYIQQLTTLATVSPPRISNHTLYKSLGLEYEDEVRKIRKEQIDLAIQSREVETLAKMPLDEIRSIKDDTEIKEIDGDLPGQAGMGGSEPPLPGESPSGGVSSPFGGSSSPGPLPPPPPTPNSFSPTPINPPK
jgi:hypothetical protein